MTLTPRTRLGPYEIESAIGAGGMGEVYKARDTRLDRSVAIKVLPPESSADPDRRARFEREAKTVAALSHPHICTLFDVGESDGTTYLVMEHLAGETLARRLEKGPLPLEQALAVATEVADALAAAHRQGVIHRDLKPGNVMLTKSGGVQQGSLQAKLLDFGLARLSAHGERPAAASLASAPTRTTPLTTEGAIVGTLQYMAPEQVEGKAADARTDLWALGAVLYEMLTGRRAFEADSAASLIGAILEREPAPVTTLLPLTPPGVNRLVRRCLAKDPDARWQSAADVADELRWLQGESAAGALAGAPSRRRRRLRVALSLVGGLAIVAAASALLTRYVALRETAPAGGTLHLTVNSEPAEGIRTRQLATHNRPARTALALTRDGRRLIFVGYYETEKKTKSSQLYSRNLTTSEPAKPIPGTDGAEEVFVSPDERWIGFSVILGNVGGKPVTEFKKVPFEGGSPQLIARARFAMGASWIDNERVVFAESFDSGLSVASSEGTTQVLTKPRQSEYSHRLPHVLPGGRAVLFTVLEQLWNWNTARVVVHRFGTPGYTDVVSGAADARYLPTGHLVYVRRGQLVAAKFDLESLKLTAGSERIVLPDVMQAANVWFGPTDSGACQIATSSTGTLAYLAGGWTPDEQRNVVWVDRTGRQVGALSIPPRPYGMVRLSPDGTRVALVTGQSDPRIWVHDLRQPELLVPITHANLMASYPVWTKDGERVAFVGHANGRYALYMARADGSEVDKPEPMGPSSTLSLDPASWTEGGELLFIRWQPGAALDIWAAFRDGATWRDREVLAASSNEMYAQMSPDGKWLAYTSMETDYPVVHVRRWPIGKDLQTVPGAGFMHSPVWSRDGRELFYGRGKHPDRELVAHAIGPDGTLAPAARSLFRLNEVGIPIGQPIGSFDVARDGRFIFARRIDATPPALTREIRVVVNWFQELREKVPVK